MHERLTDKASKVIQIASREYSRFNHEAVNTEHILFGLLNAGPLVAVNVLNLVGVNVAAFGEAVSRILEAAPRTGPEFRSGPAVWAPGGKRVLDYAATEAQDFGHDWIGTEHLLLGLLREQEGVAAQEFTKIGLRLDAVRFAVVELLARPHA
jgi:ATP-dependent Clp protease ATP-binding subunit ClpC